MRNPWLGIVGLILGTVVGLVLVLLLNGALIDKGHDLPGLLEIIIVFGVAVAGFGAGNWWTHDRDGD